MVCDQTSRTAMTTAPASAPRPMSVPAERFWCSRMAGSWRPTSANSSALSRNTRTSQKAKLRSRELAVECLLAVADEQPDGHGGDDTGDVKLLGRHVGREAGDERDRDAEQVVADDPPEDPEQHLRDDDADRHPAEHIDDEVPGGA